MSKNSTWMFHACCLKCRPASSNNQQPDKKKSPILIQKNKHQFSKYWSSYALLFVLMCSVNFFTCFSPWQTPDGWTVTPCYWHLAGCVCAALWLVGAHTGSSWLTLLPPGETPNNHKCLQRWSLMCCFWKWLWTYWSTGAIGQLVLVFKWLLLLFGEEILVAPQIPPVWWNTQVITRRNENQNCYMYWSCVKYYLVSAAGLFRMFVFVHLFHNLFEESQLQHSNSIFFALIIGICLLSPAMMWYMNLVLGVPDSSRLTILCSFCLVFRLSNGVPRVCACVCVCGKHNSRGVSVSFSPQHEMQTSGRSGSTP